MATSSLDAGSPAGWLRPALTFGNGGHKAFLPPGPAAIRLLVVTVLPLLYLRMHGQMACC